MRVKGTTVPATCEQCAQPFMAQRRHVKLGAGRFCSQDCYRASMAANVLTAADIFSTNVDRSGTCWIWTGPSRGGRGRLRFQVSPGCRQTVGASAYAWYQATGHWPTADEYVCHDCPDGDNPLCVRNDAPGVHFVRGVAYQKVGHLWLGNHAANMADRDDKGRLARGERMGSSKLTAEDVLEIRLLAGNGVKHAILAARFGLHVGTISHIKNRLCWQHI
jgi:hypothetical protein